MSWNLFQYVSYELSHSLQHLFLVYDEEKNDFKGEWVISFELKNRVCCQLSQLDLASIEEEYSSLGRLSTHHHQSTGEKSEIYHFLRKYSLYLANSFYFLFLVDLIHVFRIRSLFCNLINIKKKHEPRVRFWTEECSFCTQTFYANTYHRFLSALIISFSPFLLHYYLCCQALNGCYPIV